MILGPKGFTVILTKPNKPLAIEIRLVLNP